MYILDSVHINDTGPAERSHQVINRMYRETSKSAVQENMDRFKTQGNTIPSNRLGNRQKLKNDHVNMRMTRTKEFVKTVVTAFLVRITCRYPRRNQWHCKWPSHVWRRCIFANIRVVMYS